MIVSIAMITYNHEKFISKAISSVLMQRTDFEYELVIGEDCSIDSTRQICGEYAQKYGEVIKLLPSETNLGMIPNFIRTLRACKGKYIAFCEGDDYWTNPLKLQKQVDFLEANPDYGLIHTDFYKFHQNIQKYELSSVLEIRDIGDKLDYDSLLIENYIQTLTVCLRRDILIDNLDVIIPNDRTWYLGDYQIWLYFALFSKIKYLPEKMAVYRMLEESASYRKDRNRGLQALVGIYEVRNYFIERYGCKNETRETLKNNFINDTIHLKINVGYDLKDYEFIKEGLIEKETNNIPVTFLDKMKLFSTTSNLIWKASRVMYYIYKKSMRFSHKYIKYIP